MDLRLGGETRAKGFEVQVDIYQLANLALALIGAETVDGTKRSRDRVEKASGETEPLGLSDFVRQLLELEPWRRPSTEEAVRRIAAEEKKIQLLVCIISIPALTMWIKFKKPSAHYYLWIKWVCRTLGMSWRRSWFLRM